MVTRDLVKKEVDKVHRQYLDVLYKIIKALETSGEIPADVQIETGHSPEKWGDFIQMTYGCLAEDPIERGAQGSYALREAF